MGSTNNPEQEPKPELGIKRKDRKLTHQIGSYAVVFTYSNTQLYEHGNNLRIYDHIGRSEDGSETNVTVLLRNRNEELWDALVEADFPRIIAPYPTEGDEQLINEAEALLLQQAIDEYEEQGGAE